MAERLSTIQVRILAHLSVGASTTDMIGRVVGHGWGAALSGLAARGLVEEAMPALWLEGKCPTLYPIGWKRINAVRLTPRGRRALEAWRKPKGRAMR